MSNKQLSRIIIEIVAGIGISVAICAIAISLGYSHIYKAYYSSAHLKNYDVKLLGLKIYSLTMVDGKAQGLPENSSMMILGFVGALIFVVVAEVVIFCRERKKNIK
ncbi:MAG: LlsX family protein [Lachnospiraceae bacterium]|nr:LlsX family protein [Lachnospiraceae bacterium]HIH35158.1 LlsX family protein [Methanosphaera sp.]